MDVIRKLDPDTLTEKSKENISKRKHTSKDLGKQRIIMATPKEGRKAKPEDAEPRKLKKRLLEMSETNATLNQSLSEKNTEIENLKRSVKSLNEVLNSVPLDELRYNSSIASNKILDLSKKNRNLSTELDATKNRMNKKDMIIQKLERSLKTSEEKYRQEVNAIRKGNLTPIEELHCKLHSLQQKLFETRSKNSELHHQLRVAQKCLHSEVGNNCNVVSLLTRDHPGKPGWRSRAQQLLNLQQKAQVLKTRLDLYDRSKNSSHVVETTISAPSEETSPFPSYRSTVTSSMYSTSPISTYRLNPGLRKCEIQHLKKVEAMEKELVVLRARREVQHCKVTALKGRNKTLNAELVKYKMRVCALARQSGYSSINLDSMQEKLNNQKIKYETRMEKIMSEVSDIVRQRQAAEFREQEMGGKLESIMALVTNKEEHIDYLNRTIRDLEADLKAVCSGFLFSCKELRKEEFEVILESLETEKSILLEHIKTMHQLIKEERDRNEVLTELMAKQGIRLTELETKLCELDRESEMLSERKKRASRAAEYASSVSNTSINSSVGSFTFENSSTISTLTDSTSSSDDSTSTLEADIENQLEFASEKILMLEEKVTHLTEEKDINFKRFETTIVNTKNVIVEKLLHYMEVDDMIANFEIA